jgi:hypothetical protein
MEYFECRCLFLNNLRVLRASVVRNLGPKRGQNYFLRSKNSSDPFSPRGIDTQCRAIRAQERGAMATDVHAIRDAIATVTADIRRTMTEHYRIEF